MTFKIHPLNCVLCDFEGGTNEDYEEHMNEVHEL